jgi:hypothetical protein
LWISIYFIAAAISFAVAYNKLSTSVVITAMIAYLVGAIAQWPPTFTGIFGNSAYTELALESAGLFFCFLAMAYYVYLVIRKRSKRRE